MGPFEDTATSWVDLGIGSSFLAVLATLAALAVASSQDHLVASSSVDLVASLPDLVASLPDLAAVASELDRIGTSPIDLPLTCSCFPYCSCFLVTKRIIPARHRRISSRLTSLPSQSFFECHRSSAMLALCFGPIVVVLGA